MLAKRNRVSPTILKTPIPNQLKYKRVEAELRQLVLTLPVGSKLPAERDLAISYNCNFLTVRKSLKQLVDDGTIVRRIGSGTFVARKSSEPNSPSGTDKNIGVLVVQEINAYANRLIQAIAHAGLEQQVHLRSSWIRDFSDQSLRVVEQLKSDGCVAVTLPWFPHQKIDEVRKFVLRSPLPISLPMPIPGLEKNSFVESGAFGGNSPTEDLCQYYLGLGHKRLAFIGPDTTNDVFLQKVLTSFVCFTSRENLPSPSGLVSAGAPAMDKLAERWKSYRGDLAILSYDDEHAIRFMTAMHKIGLNAPDDYAIIGYNDTEASRYSDPPLSSVRQNFNYIGEWLLKSALALSKNRLCQSSQDPKLQLLVRSTCGGKNHPEKLKTFQLPNVDLIIDSKGFPEPIVSDDEEEPLPAFSVS